MKNRHTLKSIPLTEEDVNLITFALRKLSEETGQKNIKQDALNLIQYLESESKRKD